MNIFIWLIIVLLIIFVVLGVVLGVVLIRLSRELSRFSDDTETMLQRTRRVIRTVQLVAPLVSFIKRGSKTVQNMYRSAHSKGVSRSEAVRKK